MKADTHRNTAQLEARLNEFEVENAALRSMLAGLMRTPIFSSVSRSDGSSSRTALEADGTTTAASAPDALAGDELTSREKITLFSERFAGRDDLFAQRWESRDGVRRGYAPACSNE